MNLTLLCAAGMLSIAVSATAQDSLRQQTVRPSDLSSHVNRNNIRYISVGAYHNDTDVRETLHSFMTEEELEPSYVDPMTTAGFWSQGWFLGVSGGASAFVGDPVGCEDLFGRVRPVLQAELGKWLVPSLGARLQYQGYSMKDGSLSAAHYHAVHADFLLDVAALWSHDQDGPRATFIPFAGCGMIRNVQARTHPFSLHYGVIGSVRLASCLALNLELSSINTFKDFDGQGTGGFGDQLFSASLGMTWYVGGSRYRQRRVIDASPYMEQNRRLMLTCRTMKEERDGLAAELEANDRVLKEYEKILRIKGWLAANSAAPEDVMLGNSETSSGKGHRVAGYPYNSYSGLNSLRERLRLAGTGSERNEDHEEFDDGLQDLDKAFFGDDSEDIYFSDVPADDSIPDAGLHGMEGNITTPKDSVPYMVLAKVRRVCLGAPVLFFFELNSTDLTDPSQMENLREIADVAIRYGLSVKVIGAADSETGSRELNGTLSRQRSAFVAAELEKLGVKPSHIQRVAAGGISRYRPSVANRNTRVELYL